MRDFCAARALGIKVQEGDGRPVLMPAKLEAQSQFLNVGKKADSAVGFWSIYFFAHPTSCHQDVQNYFKQLMIFEPNLYFYPEGRGKDASNNSLC